MRRDRHQDTRTPGHQGKAILFVACYLLFAVLLGGCAKREIKNIDSKGTNIVCFGDSITFGYGANPSEGFPAQLSQMTKFTVINAGIDGDTSFEAIKRGESDILDRDPLLVIIEFGGNDFLRKIPMSTTLKNIEEMIKKIQSKGAMVAIADISTAIVMSNYGKEFKFLSQRYNTIFIPNLLSGILTDSSLKSDFIHPNADGYKIIAQRIYRVTIPYLNQNILVRKFGK